MKRDVLAAGCTALTLCALFLFCTHPMFAIIVCSGVGMLLLALVIFIAFYLIFYRYE